MISCTLTVVYLSILKYKPFLLLHLTFTLRFTVAVVTRGKVKWLGAEFTAFTASQKILKLSATLNLTLILHQSLLPVT